MPDTFNYHSITPMDPDINAGFDARCTECGHKFKLYNELDRELAKNGICFARPKPEYRTLQLVGGGSVTVLVKE